MNSTGDAAGRIRPRHGANRTRFTVGVWVLAALLIVVAALRLRPRGPEPLFILDRPVDPIDLRGVPLNQALVQLGATVGAKVVIDQKALQSAAIDPGRPVNLKAQNVTLAAALARMSPPLESGIVVEPIGGELRVMSYADLPLVTRIYDVSDLVRAWRQAPFDWPLFADFSLNSTSNNQNQNPQGGGGIGAIAPATRPANPTAEQDIVHELVNLVSNAVTPEAWSDNGGTDIIRGVGPALVIITRAPTHRRIAELLRQLRDADSRSPILQPSAPTPDAAVVSAPH